MKRQQTLAGTSLTMADGNSVDVSLQGEDLYVEETRVVTTDVQASNGVIHFIDKVMMPELNRPRPPGGD